MPETKVKFSDVRIIQRVGLTLFFCFLTSLCFAASPTVDTITPTSGTSDPNQAVSFTTATSDLDGWQNIQKVEFQVNTIANGSNCFYAGYIESTNKLYLRNDNNTAWLGGFTPGSANIIENSYAKLDCSQTTVSGSGNTLTITWSVTFKSPFTGTKNTYLRVTDDASLSNSKIVGTWTITNQAPSVGTITPSSGTSNPNQAITFTTIYSDQDGWLNIQYANLIINTSTNGANCFYGGYDQNNNKLYLRNDANTAWLGGFAPGSANIIENSYAKLDCSQTTVSGLSNTLTINWSITFKSTFTGNKYTGLYVKDDANAYAGWTQKGTWTIVDSAPPQGTIIINDDAPYTNSTSVTLTLSATDAESGVDQMQFSNDNLTWSTPEAYATTKSWIITSGDATKTVYAKFSDLVGNWSTAVSDTIILDTTPPSIIITFPQQDAVVEDSQIQLQGTVDGVSFSDTITLTSEGNNTLTKTATDLAGNSSSVSITVYLYLGKLICPEGGEVISSDGKVKVVIPAGALSECKQISILTVNKDTLENAAPSSSSLLSVVDCKPAGLVFNQPIEIIYTLDSAEIPGTSVELGSYDSLQKKIIPTGQTTTIPSDGYTVTFSGIMHFSTYAALKNLTPQSTPIGAWVKIPLPDMLTGAFSQAIPITVPPGRKGMQPNLALVYRSSNPNSWTGLGFSLNPGYIVRSTRLGPPTYDDTKDTFYFITDAGTTELVWLIDNLYQAKVESAFTKFFKETDDSWKVVGKDGSVLRFGQTSDSKEGSNSGTFAWYLTKVVDTNGNYIEYTYTKDQGKSYLSRIDYTGNEMGVSPTNSVEFFLESRNDIPSSYISSTKIATAKRLKEIQVKVNLDLVWKYVLEYNYSSDTNRSVLKSITQQGSDDKSLPKQSFTYQKAK